jgi:hypothetical protein
MIIARVVLTTGRWVLMVLGVPVSVEADPCRDPAYTNKSWQKDSLEDAARRINEAAEEKADGR